MEQLEKGSLKSEAQRKNPYPSTTATLASAGKNFMNLCAPCHGQMGRGDGPAGTALKPRPADLTIEARPSEHTDGMLLYIITHGVGQMPAFEKQLSEKQRWEMVNYLRTLAK